MIGTMLDDGIVKVHPSIEYVFTSTVTKLQAVGHEIVEWDISLNAQCIDIMLRPRHVKASILLTIAGCLLCC